MAGVAPSEIMHVEVCVGVNGMTLRLWNEFSVMNAQIQYSGCRCYNNGPASLAQPERLPATLVSLQYIRLQARQ